MKKKSIPLLIIIATITFACKSPVSDAGSSNTTENLYEGKDWYKKLDNWKKGSSVKLKLESLVGTWLRKDNTTNPPSKTELIIESNKNITQKGFQDGKLIATYTGTLSIKNTNEVVLHFTSVTDINDTYSETHIYTIKSNLYQKYWECKEKKSGTWKNTEPFYKIK